MSQSCYGAACSEIFTCDFVRNLQRSSGSPGARLLRICSLDPILAASFQTSLTNHCLSSRARVVWMRRERYKPELALAINVVRVFGLGGREGFVELPQAGDTGVAAGLGAVLTLNPLQLLCEDCITFQHLPSPPQANAYHATATQHYPPLPFQPHSHHWTLQPP